ncbi:hypothetical protein M0R45_037397 [Rubus argutus]|uniref:KRR-R motif-containing protein 1 n=1 Tax=Rubus argutus TaxID=59490 RepID=A0AAW1W257_RUBAR
MVENENGVIGQHDMSPSDLTTFDTSWMDEGIVVSFSKRYPKHMEPNLLQSEPELKHVLSICGITYTVDPLRCCMTLTTTRKEPDLTCKAKQLLQLLSVNIPAGAAFQLFNGRQSCLIKIGHQYGGLCSHFWISEEQFVERRKLLRDSREALARLTSCEIFMLDEIIVVIGRSGVKRVKDMVKDCIVSNKPPAPKIMSAERNLAMKGVKAMRI